MAARLLRFTGALNAPKFGRKDTNFFLTDKILCYFNSTNTLISHDGTAPPPALGAGGHRGVGVAPCPPQHAPLGVQGRKRKAKGGVEGGSLY